MSLSPGPLLPGCVPARKSTSRRKILAPAHHFIELHSRLNQLQSIF